MKKTLALLAAALLLGLGGCGQRPSEETPPVTAAPIPSSAVTATVKPVSTPVTAVTPRVTQIPESPAPVESLDAAPSPAATAKPTRPVAATPEPTESMSVLPPAPTPTPEVPAPTPTPAVTPSGATEPSDEEVLAAYREAAEVMGWFAGYQEPELDREDQIAITAEDRGGQVTLYRVVHDRLNNMDELRAYLKTLFSDEVVDALMKNGSAMFADGPEGGLYTTGAGRGSDATKGGVVLSVERSGETPLLCLVRAEVELLGWTEGAAEPTVTGTQVYQFPYQKVGDKWVFTQFESIF